MKKRIIQLSGLGLFVCALFIGALFLADHIASNSTAQIMVEQFGYFGILAISIVSGLNLLLPLPAPLFVPVFTAAGYPLISVIATIAIGITIADSIAYCIGVLGKKFTEQHHPKVLAFLKRIQEQNHVFIIPVVFLYSALVPLPNEIIMIPLAMMGFAYTKIIIPFVLGTIVYVSVLAYGAQNIFELFF